ncbi:hypothetical protein [Mesorhizobium sp. M0496]
MTSIVQDKAIADVELLLLIVADKFGPTTTRISLKRAFTTSPGLADVYC